MTKLSLSRREILCGAATLGVAALTAPVSSSALAATQKRVSGVQLYTVRDAMATDVAATLQAIAGIGYREVEFAGYFDQTPAQIRNMLDDLGLVSPSAHTDARFMRDDPHRVIDAAAEVGHQYVTVAWLRPEDRESIDDYRNWAEVFNRAGEHCAASGLRLAYHNHEFEFEAMQGEVPFDVLLAETDASLVDIELDFFWVRTAGRDILEVIRQAPERITMSHIKDFDADGNMVDVGEGTTDFAGILSNPAAAAIRHCFVEHDAPPDPFQSVAFSHYTLKSILD